jgi:hypothetical protein
MSESEVANIPVEVPAPKGKGKGKARGQRDPSQEPCREAAEGMMAGLEERVAQLEAMMAKMLNKVVKVDELEQALEDITDEDDGVEARMAASLNRVIGDQGQRLQRWRHESRRW